MHPVLARWHEKLSNWALWVTGAQSRVGGAAHDGEYGEGAPRPPPPLVGAALDTDQLVQQLASEHRQAVEAVYVWTGQLAERAAFIGIHPDTLADRCTAAKWRLDELEQRRERGRAKYRVPAA